MSDEIKKPIPVTQLGLSERVVKALHLAGIVETNQLSLRTPDNIYWKTTDLGPSWNTVGEGGLIEIRIALKKIGMSLFRDEDEEGWFCRGCTVTMLNNNITGIPFLCSSCALALCKHKPLIDFFRVMIDKGHEDAIFTVAQAEVEFRRKAHIAKAEEHYAEFKKGEEFAALKKTMRERIE